MNRGYLSQQQQGQQHQLQPMHQGYPPSIYHQNQQSQPHMQQQQQQQQQQQSLLNGQNPNQQMNGNASMDGQSQAASGGQIGQEMNLASVLHYLQSEWRRWERDRNEWEIERAEMRARIALLEGQRRSAENLKVDLLRRVKMLEFALRQERTKAVSSSGSKAPAIAPTRLAALQDEDKVSVKDEKEGSGSEGSEEGTFDRLKMNGANALGRPVNITGRAVPDTSAWKSIGSVPPRDPKSRARSREYLKQCLQEITYLTSPGALNPLPSRPPVSVPETGSPGGSDPELNAGPIPERPIKTIPEEPVPSPFAPKMEVKEEPSDPPQAPPADNAIRDDNSSVKQELMDINAEQAESARGSLASYLPDVDKSAQPPSSPAVRTMSLPDTEANGMSNGKPHQDEDGASSQETQLLTAIYRPESKAAWREELRAANEKAEKIRKAQNQVSEGSDEEQLASLSLAAEEAEIKKDTSDTSDSRELLWGTSKVLRSHLDIVRSISFASGPGVLLASGGDDNTVKVWSIETSSALKRKMARKMSTNTQPIATFHGHTAAVTTVLISSSLETVFSASMDKTIRLWRLPAPTSDPYGPYDHNTSLQILEGHTDIVWDLVLLPAQNGSGKEDRLVSASADGTVKLWTMEDGTWSLKKSFSFDEGAIPTCLAVYYNDYSKVLVGLTDGRVLLWDIGRGAETMCFGEKAQGAQPNAILSHPDSSTIYTAHEDGHLRFFDVKHGSSPTHTVLAHPAPVTSLALSPLTGLSLLTASADCTAKLWNLVKKTASHEWYGHRNRFNEGILSVASHPELPIVATAGADGIIRIHTNA